MKFILYLLIIFTIQHFGCDSQKAAELGTQASTTPVEKKIFFDLPANKLEEAFSHSNMYKIPSTLLEENYRYDNDLSGGLSGSKILLISRITKKNDDENKQILKVLTEISRGENLWETKGFREVYFAKRLSELQSTDFLPSGMKSNEFFPRFFGFGLVGHVNPFANQRYQSDKSFPSYLMEYLHGMSLVDFAKNPRDATNLFGYNLKTAPRGIMFSILFQITVALINADKEIGFSHLDIHPGNIILLAKPLDNAIFTYQGKKIPLIGPKVKILDFDQSELKHARPTPRPIYGYRPVIGKELDLYEAEHPDEIGIPALYVLKSFAQSENTDIRALNFLFYTFKERFEREGKFEIKKDFYNSLDELLRVLGENAGRILAKSNTDDNTKFLR